MNKTRFRVRKLSVLLLAFLISFVFLSTIKFAYASNVVVAYENFDDDVALSYIVSGAVFTTDNFANHQIRTDGLSGFGNFIQIANQTQSNAARYINSTHLTSFLDKNTTNAQVMGVWFSPNGSQTSDYAWGWLRWINNADGYYIALTFSYSSGWNVGFSFLDGTGYHTSTGTYALSDGNWYWVELRYYYNVVSYYLDYYVNGSVQSGGWAGVGVDLTGTRQEIQMSLVGSGSSLRCGWYCMDFIRLANFIEFPPAAPPDLMTFGLSIPNLEGCGDWVFVNERYYDFNLSVTHNYGGARGINRVYMYFDTDTRDGTVTNVFYWDSENFTVSFDPSSTIAIPTQIIQGTASYSTDNLTLYLDFPIWFRPDSLDQWKEPAITVTARALDTDDNDSDVVTALADAFHIYNQGGFVLNSTITGDAGILDASTPFSFYAENGSYVYRDLIYRDLVHVKMLPQISGLVGRQTFYVSYGIDYCLQDYDWVEGWKVILGANSITTGSIIYFNWTISFWNRGSWIATEYLSTFVHTNVPRGYYDMRLGYGFTTSLWIDFWFDRTNASSVGGVRINAYEYPMRDNVEPWLMLLTSNWGPIENATKEAQQMVPLLDGDNATIIPASKIKMVKLWSSLEVAIDDETDQLITISDYPVWDLTFSQPFPPLTGIQTPIFEQTTYPNMPGGGIMGALFSGMSSWFKWLGENILYGGLNLWGTFVGFLDTISAWLGFPGGFTALVNWLAGGWTWLIASFGYIGQMLVQFFIILGASMGYIVALLTMAATQFVTILTTLVGFFQGSYGTGLSIWNDFGLTTWLTLALICYPLYLVFMWDEDGFDAVMSHLTFVFNILSMLAHFFISVIQMVFTGISTIVEAIPVVE